MDVCCKMMPLLFNMLSRFVIAFLPKNKCLLVSRLQLPSTVILESKKIVYHCFHFFPIYLPWSNETSLVAQTVKRLPTMRQTWVWSLGQEDPLEKEMATHSSTLAWKIPWTEEPGRLQSMGFQKVGHDWVSSLFLFASMWNECKCAVVWTFFGIALLWDWNENWPFPDLWPLLSFLNLPACWMQHFHSIIF